MKSGATATIPLVMLIRKYYCHKCGEPLKIKNVKRVLRPGEPGYDSAYREIFDQKTAPKGSIAVTESVFFCLSCQAETTYDEQKEIAVKQKQAGARIL